MKREFKRREFLKAAGIGIAVADIPISGVFSTIVTAAVILAAS